MNCLRVLHMMTSLGPGGAETNLLALLKYFDRNGYEHAVAFGGGGTLEKEFQNTGVKLIPLSSKPLSLTSIFKLPSMIKKIDEYSPDIIHSHLDLPNIIALPAKLLRRYPLILHFHGLGIMPRSELPGRDWKHWLFYSIAHLYRICDKAIAICNFQFPYLKKLGIHESNIFLIPNGISFDNGSEIIAKESSDSFKFINVARFYPEKNHELLLKAFHRLVQKLSNVKLLLVGDGPLRPMIERKVSELRLSDKVMFLGVRRDIPERLAASDCFVLSSRWELHPITILEAMRAGLPVIATDVGGVADTVLDGISGVVVKPCNEVELCEAMLSMASNPMKCLEMGKQGHILARERFNNKIVAKKIEDVYQAVVEKPDLR